MPYSPCWSKHIVIPHTTESLVIARLGQGDRGRGLRCPHLQQRSSIIPSRVSALDSLFAFGAPFPEIFSLFVLAWPAPAAKILVRGLYDRLVSHEDRVWHGHRQSPSSGSSLTAKPGPGPVAQSHCDPDLEHGHSKNSDEGDRGIVREGRVSQWTQTAVLQALSQHCDSAF